MDFLKALKELYGYINSFVNSREEGSSLDPKRLIGMIDNVLLKGLRFRAGGLELLTTEQFNVLRDLLNGLTSMTNDKMKQIQPDLPELFVILTFIEKVDRDSYLSLLYLLEP